MPFLPDHRSVISLDHLSSPRDMSSVLENARRLQKAADAGDVPPLLRGRRLGLLCEDDTVSSARLFRNACIALGAHVAHLRPSLSGLATPQDVQHTAHMLGRLYDAVECQGLDPAVVLQLRSACTIPIYDGIASREHPTAALDRSLDGGAAPDRRRFVLQAALLQTISNLWA
jgi:ornithine carbamoyltransferase